MTDNVHPVRLVEVGAKRAEIDELLAPLIEATWRLGIATLTSCQDAGESNVSWLEKLPHMIDYIERRRGWAFVDFHVMHGLKFLDTLANAGPRDAFYVRMVHWAAPDAWDVSIRPMDAAMFNEEQPSQFDLRLLQVCFPAYDIPEVVRRLEQAQRGEVVEPAPTDWSTVGR